MRGCAILSFFLRPARHLRGRYEASVNLEHGPPQGPFFSMPREAGCCTAATLLQPVFASNLCCVVCGSTHSYLANYTGLMLAISQVRRMLDRQLQ